MRRTRLRDLLGGIADSPPGCRPSRIALRARWPLVAYSAGMAIRRLDLTVCAQGEHFWWQVRKRDQRGRDHILYHGIIHLQDEAEEFTDAYLLDRAWSEVSAVLWPR